MGRTLLSEGLAEKGRVRLLRAALPDRRDQRHVLSAADAQDGPRLARALARGLRFRRQRQPLPHAHPPAARHEQRPAKIFQPPEAARRSHRPDPLATAAELREERRELQTPRPLPRETAADVPPRRRVPAPVVVRRADDDAAAREQRGERVDQLAEDAGGPRDHERLRVPAVSRPEGRRVPRLHRVRAAAVGRAACARGAPRHPELRLFQQRPQHPRAAQRARVDDARRRAPGRTFPARSPESDARAEDPRAEKRPGNVAD